MGQRLILNRWEIFFPFSPPPPPGDLLCCPCWIYEAGGPEGILPIMPFEGAHVPSSCHWPSRCLGLYGISLPARQDCLSCKVPTWRTGRKQTHFPTTMGTMFSWFKKYFVQGGWKQAGRTLTFCTARGWATGLLGDCQQLSDPLWTPAFLLRKKRLFFPASLKQ